PEPEPEPEPDDEDDWLTSAIEEVENPQFDSEEADQLSDEAEQVADEAQPSSEAESEDVASTEAQEDDWLTSAIDEVERPESTPEPTQVVESPSVGLDEPTSASGAEQQEIVEDDVLAQQEQSDTLKEETPETPETP
ncbi:hypothetical protein, partial [Vibrio tubiashii]